MVLKKLQKGLFLSHSSKPVITTFVCVLSVCRRRGKQKGTSINVSTLTVFKPNSIFQNMPCCAHWQSCFFFFFFFLLLLFWHTLWLSDCWEMLLGSNSNLNGNHKIDHAARYGEDLWWWYNWQSEKSLLLLHCVYCSTVLGGRVWKHFIYLNFEIISVISGCQDIIYQPLAGLFTQLHLTQSERKW